MSTIHLLVFEVDEICAVLVLACQFVRIPIENKISYKLIDSSFQI